MRSGNCWQKKGRIHVKRVVLDPVPADVIEVGMVTDNMIVVAKIGGGLYKLHVIPGKKSYAWIDLNNGCIYYGERNTRRELVEMVINDGGEPWTLSSLLELSDWIRANAKE